MAAVKNFKHKMSERDMLAAMKEDPAAVNKVPSAALDNGVHSSIKRCNRLEGKRRKFKCDFTRSS